MNTVLFCFLILIYIVQFNKAICPSRCMCADHKLEAFCIDSGLEVVPIQLNPEVQSVVLRENRITNVHYTLSFYTELKTLDLSVNKINVLGSHNFESQRKLVHLNISYNEIAGLSKDTFKGLEMLKTLDLSFNRISAINKTAFRDTISLELLVLSNNNISYFEESEIFTSLKNLRILKLDNNQILDVPTNVIRHLPHQSLHFLYLNDNLIDTVEDNAFPFTLTNLHTLSLSSNIINSINETSFITLRSLHTLDLSNNNLSTIPTKQLNKLSALANMDLSGNNFKSIESVAFRSLFSLKMVKINLIPNLVYIDERAFVDNIQLETVIINENMNLRELPQKLFYGNTNLKAISLKGNSLIHLEASHFPLERITFLDLSDNPLHCDCSLLWLWILVQLQVKTVAEMTTTAAQIVVNDTATTITTTPVLPKAEKITKNNHTLTIVLDHLKCSSPQEIKGKEVKDIAESYVHCDTNVFFYVISFALLIISSVVICVLLFFIYRKRVLWKEKINKSLKQRPYGENIATQPAPVLMLYSTPHNQYEHNEKLNSFPNGKIPSDAYPGHIQIYDKYPENISIYNDDNIYEKEPFTGHHAAMNGTVSREENEYYPRKIPINDSFRGKIKSSRNNFAGKYSSNENCHYATPLPSSFNSSLRKNSTSSQDVQYFDQWKNHSNGIYMNPHHTLNPSSTAHYSERSPERGRSRTSRKKQASSHVVYV